MKFKNKKLMTVGPTEIEEDILKLGSEKMVYNRTPEFSEFIEEIHENLKYIFQTKNDVFILTCSGTGAMEAAVVNLLSEGDKVLVANNGNFGERWVEICKSYGVIVKEIIDGFGNVIDPIKIQNNITEEIKAVFITANETSSCTLSDVKTIGKIVKDTNAVFVIDAISSLIYDEFKTDDWNCDVALISSNKGLALPPGLAFITFSEKAWKFVEGSSLPKYYFNIKDYKSNMERGQTPYTPPIGILFQLHERLTKIKEEGIENIIKRHGRLSKLLRAGVNAMNLKFTSKNLSNVAIGIFTPDGINAKDIIFIMKEEYNIQITPSPPPLDEKVIRISVLGNIKEDDVIDFLNAFEATLIKLGYKLEKGLAENKAMEVILK